MTYEEESILQVWKLITCIAVQRMGGLMRITDAELRDYVSDMQAPAYQAVPGEGIDVWLMTAEEIKAWRKEGWK